MPTGIAGGIAGLEGLLRDGSAEAKRKLAGGVRDWSAGQRQRLGADAARRGIGGTGVEGELLGGLESEMGRQVAGGLADIEMGEMDRQQSVLGDIMGGSATGTGLQQTDRAQAARLAEARLERWRAMEDSKNKLQEARMEAALRAISVAGGWANG